MRGVGNWLVSVAALLLMLAWCVACVTGPLWLVGLIPFDGYLVRTLHAAAAFLGLWFALWSVAKLSRGRV